MPESFQYDSGRPGPRLAVFGAIHGNEVCGPDGIRRVMADLDRGTSALIAGSITFVPVANPRAYTEGKRFTEENLNRVFRKTEHPKSYEAQLANELCMLLDSADVLLDLHSSAAPGPVNLFVDYPNTETEAFVRGLGAEVAIYEWPNVYASRPELDAHTTERYMHERGGFGTTVECGQHEDPESKETAYQVLYRALKQLGLMAPTNEHVAPPARIVRMQALYTIEHAEDAFLGEWKHLERIPNRTPIAKRANGEIIRAEDDVVMIFPKAVSDPGSEWFYLGTET